MENFSSFPSSPIHPNLKLLSHSSDTLFDKCPRKYELYKLSTMSWSSELKSISHHEELSNLSGSDVHLDFGSVVGIGTQRYLVDNSYNSAVLDMLRSWEGNLENESGHTDKKSFYFALVALDKFTVFRELALSSYEIAIFDSKPAIELGFTIDCGNGFLYRGFLDALLFNKRTGELVPYEGKTTKFREIHEAAYKHSGQALGYSLIVDSIAASLGMEHSSSFEVLYSIYKSSSMEWQKFLFEKTHTHRALWIKNLLIRMGLIGQYAEMGYFPMHGWNCMDFFKPCEFFGTCERDSSLVYEMAVEKKDDPEKYQFHFNLQEILETQLERTGGL